MHSVLREVCQTNEELLFKMNAYDETINRAYIFVPKTELEIMQKEETCSRGHGFWSKNNDYDSDDSTELQIEAFPSASYKQM
mmetsp:Transcript_15409/g.17859  ORF Transcript_15409/g.17859 Transcript_15409/m.17859 type:complete len:82 (-) Transcript_15409:45-290(-)